MLSNRTTESRHCGGFFHNVSSQWFCHLTSAYLSRTVLVHKLETTCANLAIVSTVHAMSASELCVAIMYPGAAELGYMMGYRNTNRTRRHKSQAFVADATSSI